MANIADVVKGLELCTKVFYGATGICDSCPYFKHEGLCLQQLNEDALELLKSQQAEIKKLKSGSQVVPCSSCAKRRTTECPVGMATETDRTIHGCNVGEWKDGNEA